jgi:ABC-2 type transport system permease protein
LRDNGQDEQRVFLHSLRRSRAAAFRHEIVPHFRYVFQSGFGLFASAILFAALIWYVDFIKAVPSSWPADIVGVIVLTLAVIRAPLRTYFRSADEIFLLPMEGRMIQNYIKPALRSAIVMGMLRTLLVFAIYSPIYSRSPITEGFAQDRPMLLTAILLAIVAGCNVYGGWRERRPAARIWRVSLKAVRWLLTALAVAALLLKPFLIAIGFLLLVMILVWLLWRIPSQHAVPWEKLIAEEEAVRRRWMSFLGWFVDVPTETSKPLRRRWISWLGDRYLGQQQRAWHFLYAKAFLRGETFGAFSRWVVLSSIIIVVSGNKIAGAIIYGVSILIVGLQLSELRRVRFVETAETLPIAPEGRLVAAAAISRMAGMVAVSILVVVGILTVNLGISGTGSGLDIWLPLLIVGLLWCGWWIPRKIAKFADEDDL